MSFAGLPATLGLLCLEAQTRMAYRQVDNGEAGIMVRQCLVCDRGHVFSVSGGIIYAALTKGIGGYKAELCL